MEANIAIANPIFESTTARRAAAAPRAEQSAPAAAVPVPTNASLISPWADHMMIGGASLIVFALYHLFVDKSVEKTGVVEAAFWLSFVINFPHFLSSYQLLYGDNRAKLFTKKSFFWAGVLAPALIIGGLVAGTVFANVQLLGLMGQLMYLSVGWHYMKQIFGTAVVTSAAQKRYFTEWERNFILLNLYSLWAISWVGSNLSGRPSDLDGLTYYTLALPEYLLTAAYVSAGLSLVIVIAIAVHKYIRTGVRPATAAMVSFAAIYAWYIPALDHPSFLVLVPFFHSLQYMLFVVAMKRSQASSAAAEWADGPSKRLTFMRKFWGFLVLAAILGALSFELVPRFFDQIMPMNADVFGPTYWMFAFSIFLNLHHYFIDNVIWRGDNEMLRKHVVQAAR